MAVGCSHGDRINQKAADFVLEFKERFKPDVVIHGGDFIDTAAFRRGAKGTSDEAASIPEDFNAGIDFLLRLAPSVILCGNHEHRLYSLQQNPNAIIAHCAGWGIGEINKTAEKLKAKVYPYHVFKGWHMAGETLAFTHGYTYGESAIRDHAERAGRSVVMFHKHVLAKVPSRNLVQASGYCGATLADIDQMDYAHARFATLGWENGFVWGEYNETSHFVQLCALPTGRPWRFPV